MRYIDVTRNTSNLVVADRPLARIGFIVHTSSGLDSLRWLQGDSAKSGEPASADFLITRKGEIYKITPDDKFAYHAGYSSTSDGSNHGYAINQQYIGIELENNDAYGECVTDAQYQACAYVIRERAAKYGMSPIKLYGHANIAIPFGRRSDPVRFDYGLLFYYCSNPTASMT